MAKWWERYRICGLLGLLVLTTVFLGMWKDTELGIYDAWFSLRGKIDPGKEIVVIAMDEKSIRELGPLPWSREVHAELLGRLSLARVVGFDILFDTPSEADLVFSEAIQAQGSVVLASMFSFERDETGQWMQNLLMPLPEFSSAAAAMGFINMPVDKGNTIRRTTVIDTNTFNRPYPSLGLAVILAATGLNPEEINFKDNILTAGDLKIPLDHNHQAHINFWGPGRTFPYYSFADVLADEFPQETFKDKIIFIGTDTPTHQSDYFENPFTKGNLVLAGELPSPGVEFHASAVKTFLSGNLVQRAPWALNLFILFLAWAVPLFIVRRSSPLMGFFLVALCAVLLVAFVYFSWLTTGLWIYIGAPLLMLAVTYTGTTVENYVRTEKERKKTRALFQRYVSPEVVDELMRNPDDIDLEGVQQDVTILFLDIEGFSTFSNNSHPRKVVARLNEFFEVMADIVFRYRGTLDKYLGDGLIVVFGAPVYYRDHAVKGANAALEMLNTLEELNQDWVKRGETTFQIRIGICSGIVIAGNIGCHKKMEYTVIGDPVNIASRLETLNKELGTQILCSEETINHIQKGDLPENWEIKDLGLTQIRGIKEEITVFTFIKEVEFRRSAESKSV